jgi:hypothetical protein
VIAVDAGPGFRMHLQPSEGRSRDVARPKMEISLPPGAQRRIPIFAITVRPVPDLRNNAACRDPALSTGLNEEVAQSACPELTSAKRIVASGHAPSSQEQSC